MFRIYSKTNCKWCDKAKEFFETENFSYEEILLGRDITKAELLEIVPGATTVPQIFIDSKYIGGYTELLKYMNSGD